MDEIRRIIIEAKIAALLEYAIPNFQREAVALLSLLRQGQSPTLEQITALNEELYFLTTQGQDAAEDTAEVEDALTNELISGVSTEPSQPEDAGLTPAELNAVLDLGYTVINFTPGGIELTHCEGNLDSELGVFRKFLEGLDG